MLLTWWWFMWLEALWADVAPGDIVAGRVGKVGKPI